MHHDLQKQKLGPNCGHPITGLPINCCTSPTTSPGGPMSSFATLNAFNPHKVRVNFHNGLWVMRARDKIR